MPLTSVYNAGTATVAANATAVTIAGGSLTVAGVREGDQFAARGLSVTILSVTDATHLTLAQPWPGTALSAAPYEIRFISDTTRVLVAARQAIADIGALIAGGGGGTGTGSVAWTAVTNKPVTFPPSTHSHTISQVTGLQAALDSLTASEGPASTWDQILLKPTEFPPSAHSHTAADLPDFSAALADKLDASRVSAFALTLLDDTTAAAFRASLGLGAVALLASITTAAIANGAVTNVKLANMASGTIKGNAGATAVAPSDLTAAQVKAILGIAIQDVEGLDALLDSLSTRISALEGTGTPAPTGTPPVITRSATFTGPGTVGGTHVTSVGAATGNPTPTYSVAIRRGSDPAVISTSLSYVAVAADAGQSLTSTTTWTNMYGSASSSATIAIDADVSPPPGPTHIYDYDWESGNTDATSGWHALSSTLVTTPDLGGNYAARVVGGVEGWGYMLSVGATPRTTLYARQKVRLDVTTEPTTDMANPVWASLIQFGDGTNWPLVLNHIIYPNGTSNLIGWVNPAAGSTEESPDIARGQILDLEVMVVVAATNGRFLVRVNGVNMIDFTGNTGTLAITHMQFAAQAATPFGAAFTHYFDDHIGAVTDWPLYDGGTGTPPPPPTGAIFNTAVATGVQSGRLGLALNDNDYINSPYGTNQTVLNDAYSVGAKWVRIDMRVDKIKSSAGGTPDWSYYDAVVNTFTAGGRKILPILMPGGWLGQAMTTSTERNHYRDHCVACVNRYKDRVQHWQLMNELNHSKKMTSEIYALVSNLVYPAMKAADPNCFVVYQGASSIEFDQTDHWGALPYLQRVFQAGGGNSFDALANHVYTVWSMPSEWPGNTWHAWNVMYKCHDFLVSQGQGHKQIWITEYGSAVQGAPDGTSEAHQLAVIQEAYDMTINDSRIGPMFIYTHKDRAPASWVDDAGSETYFGLERRDGTIRPAYTRFQQITTRDNNKQFLRPSSGTATYFAGRLFDVPGNNRRQGVTYSMTALAGVSINATTGIISVTSTATAGTVTITGSIGGQSATNTLQIVTS